MLTLEMSSLNPSKSFCITYDTASNKVIEVSLEAFEKYYLHVDFGHEQFEPIKKLNVIKL